MTRNEREQLNSLSKQAFGTSSRWAKIVANGTVDKLSRDREVMVPSANGNAIETKVFTDHKNVTRRYTVEEVKTLMEDILAKRLQKQSD